MGGDGGTIQVGRKFLRGQEEQKRESKDVRYEQKVRSENCAQSSLPLVEPIVACELGNLYSKENLLTALVDKTLNKTCSHLRGLKDIRQLIFHASSSSSASSAAGSSASAAGADDEASSKWACPITQQPFNGVLPFVFIWTTGHVLSEKAVAELGVEALQEYGPFTPQDVIRLLPSEHEAPAQAVAMDARRERSKRGKKEGKRKAGAGVEGAAGEVGEGPGMPKDGELSKEPKRAKDTKPAPEAPHKSIAHSSAVMRSTHLNNTAAKEESAIFSSLFHSDAGGDKSSANSLFIGALGMKYTLG